jgi:predicted DNA-binding transcriptional regulator AlpA
MSRILSVEQAAELTGYSVSWLYQNHDKTNGPTSIQRAKGKKLRFREADIEEFNG